MIRFVKYNRGEPRVVTIPRWAIGLGLAAAFLLGLMVIVLAAGIALVAIPTLLAAGGIAAWLRRGKSLSGRNAVAPHEEAFGRKPFGPEPFGEERFGGVRRPAQGGIEDAEFRVVERDDKR